MLLGQFPFSPHLLDKPHIFVKNNSWIIVPIVWLKISMRRLKMFGAALTLLRAGIAEGLRTFEMPCRWTFNM